MEQVASFLGYSGNYAAACVLQQQIVEAREQVLGAEHLSTLTTRANLASGPGGRGIRPRPATSSLRCYRPASESPAPSIPTP
jgi:hypothetical protein